MREKNNIQPDVIIVSRRRKIRVLNLHARARALTSFREHTRTPPPTRDLVVGDVWGRARFRAYARTGKIVFEYTVLSRVRNKKKNRSILETRARVFFPFGYPSFDHGGILSLSLSLSPLSLSFISLSLSYSLSPNTRADYIIKFRILFAFVMYLYVYTHIHMRLVTKPTARDRVFALRLVPFRKRYVI